MAENDEKQSVTKAAKKPSLFAAKLKFAVVGLVVGLVIGVGGSLFLQHYNPPAVTEPLAASVVFERVKAQNEMISASQKYNITEKAGNSNKIPFTDIAIPFTSNSFWYRYVGVIKVGVNLENAEFKQQGKTLTIMLDQPQISSNTPNMKESGVLEENNNILNPIHIEDVDGFRASCMELSESQAIDGGIFDEARTNAEQNLRNMFNAALGDDYEIAFEWRDAQ